MEKIGEVEDEEIEEIKEILAPEEEIRIIVGKRSKRGKDTHSLIITDKRVITWKKGREKLMKESERYKDFLYPSITSISVEPKKKYDLFRIETQGEIFEEIMIPKGKGKEVASKLREEQLKQRQ